jgi:hypothetical protein
MGYQNGPEAVYAARTRMRRVTSIWSKDQAARQAAPLFLASLLGLAACSLSNVDHKTLPDGSHELTCRSHLSTCLVAIQETCAEAGYDVVSASEERKRAGPATIETETVRSQATVRCRTTPAIFGGDSAKPEAPRPAPSAPVSAPPPPVCQPGTTQVCVGTGACQGGQQCLRDGSGFGECDCGPPPAPQIPAENTNPPAPLPAPNAVPAPSPAPTGSAPKTPGP